MDKINRKKPAMARKKTQDNEKTGFFLGLSHKKNIMFAAVFLGASGIGWGLVSLMQEPDAPITWQSCLLERHDGSAYPDMMEIPAGNHELSTSLYGGGEDLLMTAQITNPFLIQKEEVTLADFKKYAEYVNGL
ncbi:MAG: hypothetical protein HQL69_15335, partial [Magnetococcales bacterium]|nr:hypothetical protein [Magnetococcales bacterium]